MGFWHPAIRSGNNFLHNYTNIIARSSKSSTYEVKLQAAMGFLLENVKNNKLAKANLEEISRAWLLEFFLFFFSFV